MILQPEITAAGAREILVGKLRSYFEGCGKKKAVLGLSGGIDSAVVFALACEALGSKNVHAILMPSQYSTLHSVADAVELAVRMNASYEVIPIETIYGSFLLEMRGHFRVGEWDVALENLQARIRGTILMTWANRHDGLLLNTSNKSEIFMGYGTLYGDLCGALMVIGDLYKLQVYELAREINSRAQVIPPSTITKAPSAELRPNQKDTDSLPPYEELDPLLHALHEEGKSPQEMIEAGNPKDLVERVVRLKQNSAFKLMQLPPILTVAGRPLMPDWKCI